MATLIPNDFQQYELTEEEILTGSILNESTYQLVSNRLATAMIERANLEYVTSTPITTFVQQEAALMGEIRAWRTLLDAHNAALVSTKESGRPAPFNPLDY